jgi:hypothetical protein
MYALIMFFQGSLTFVSKAGAYLSGAHYSSPANIGLDQSYQDTVVTFGQSFLAKQTY